MELSGIDRLLSFARELGVGDTREVARSEKFRPAHVDSASGRRDDRISDPDLEISLSETASRLAEGLAVPIPIVQSPSESIEGVRTQSTPQRRSRVIAAYQRNASAIPGERIRVTA